MTPNENAAFRAGIRHAADMALITALALEIRDDANHLRQQAAIAALQGFAEALKATAAISCSQPDLNRTDETTNLLQPHDVP